jgi:hypothetical protein
MHFLHSDNDLMVSVWFRMQYVWSLQGCILTLITWITRYPFLCPSCATSSTSGECKTANCLSPCVIWQELLVLEDRIGYVSTGLREDEIICRFRMVKHWAATFADFWLTTSIPVSNCKLSFQRNCKLNCTLLFSEKNSRTERCIQLDGGAAGFWSPELSWNWQHWLGRGGARVRGGRGRKELERGDEPVGARARGWAGRS